jgi:hypothetical protein
MNKFDECEHCHKPRIEGELLYTVDCWVISERDGRRRPSYWLVCNACYEKRQDWCANVFPDACEQCGEKIKEGEHYFEGYDRLGSVRLASQGMSSKETCRVICEACWTTMGVE